MKKIIIKTANEEVFNAFNDELLTPLKADLKNSNHGHVKEDDNQVVITINSIPKS